MYISLSLITNIKKRRGSKKKKKTNSAHHNGNHVKAE